MKKHLFSIVISLIVFFSFFINRYVTLNKLSSQEQTFELSPLYIFNDYFVKPIFWLSIGILFGCFLSKMGGHKGKPSRKLCLWIGLLILFIYGIFLTLIYCTKIAFASHIILEILIWITKNTPVFLVPGILIGISAI